MFAFVPRGAESPVLEEEIAAAASSSRIRIVRICDLAAGPSRESVQSSNDSNDPADHLRIHSIAKPQEPGQVRRTGT